MLGSVIRTLQSLPSVLTERTPSQNLFLRVIINWELGSTHKSFPVTSEHHSLNWSYLDTTNRFLKICPKSYRPLDYFGRMCPVLVKISTIVCSRHRQSDCGWTLIVPWHSSRNVNGLFSSWNWRNSLVSSGVTSRIGRPSEIPSSVDATLPVASDFDAFFNHPSRDTHGPWSVTCRPLG